MGLKQGSGRGGEERIWRFLLSSPAPPPFHRPSPLVFFVAFQDGGHDQCTSEFSLKNACSAGYTILFMQLLLCTRTTIIIFKQLSHSNQVHHYEIRLASKYRPHFCGTNIQRFSILYQGPKIWTRVAYFINHLFFHICFFLKNLKIISLIGLIVILSLKFYVFCILVLSDCSMNIYKITMIVRAL